MVVHHNDAPVADGAVVCPDRLHVVALTTLLVPERLQVGGRLRPVPEQLFYLLRDPLEPVVLHILNLPVLPLHRLQPAPILSLLNIFSQLFDFLIISLLQYTYYKYLEVKRTAGLDHASEEMVVYDVIE